VFVVATTDEDDTYTTATSTGTFETSLNLAGGVNPIKIFAFDLNGKQAQTQITTVFSTEYDKSTPQPVASGSADAIRQKVDEKLKEASATPLAYMGTVTDLTDNTIQ